MMGNQPQAQTDPGAQDAPGQPDPPAPAETGRPAGDGDAATVDPVPDAGAAPAASAAPDKPEEPEEPAEQQQGSNAFYFVPPPQPPADSNEARAIEAAWSDQAVWSAVATRLGDSIFAWRIVAAVAGVLGLALTVAAGSGWLTGQATVGATIGVLLLAAVPYLREHLVSDQRVQRWTQARVASEDLKQALYRHLMGVLQPVPGGASPTDQGATNLVRRCREIKAKVADLAGDVAAVETQLERAANPADVSKPRSLREQLADALTDLIWPPARVSATQPKALTVDRYVALRVEGQMRYFRSKGRRNARITQALRTAELVLGLVTVLMGAWASGLAGSIDEATLKRLAPGADAKAVAEMAGAASAGASLVRAPGMAASGASGAASAPGTTTATTSDPAEATTAASEATGATAPAAAASAVTPPRPGQGNAWLAALALLAAATSAITSYLMASRHATLAAKYFATYDRLKDLLAEFRVAPDHDTPDRVARFVHSVERAIEAEYTDWVKDWAQTRQPQK